jgi:hypothetical protein
VVLDLQDLDNPGHDLQLSAQGIAFGADSGRVLLLLDRADLHGRTSGHSTAGEPGEVEQKDAGGVAD